MVGKGRGNRAESYRCERLNGPRDRKEFCGLRGQWNRERELRSLADFALNPQPAAMSFHDVLRDRKAQPRAACFARTRRVHTVEPLENPILLPQRHSDA